MKIIAINGSPRMNHNTSALLNEAAKGAISVGAEVEVVNLYKLNYKGCIACMSCKRKGSSHACAIKDDLTTILEKIKSADGIIFASPIYFSDVTGEMRSFLERVLYPYLPYDTNVKEGTYFPKTLKTAFIYSMGQPKGVYETRLEAMENFLSLIFKSKIKTFHANYCYPFLDEYEKYEASDLSFLAKQKEEVFPIVCKKAFEFGIEFVLS